VALVGDGGRETKLVDEIGDERGGERGGSAPRLNSYD